MPSDSYINHRDLFLADVFAILDENPNADVQETVRHLLTATHRTSTKTVIDDLVAEIQRIKDRKEIDWDVGADWETSRAAYEKGNYDKPLAKQLAGEMATNFRSQRGKLVWGPSIHSSLHFDFLLKTDPRVKHLSDITAKALYLGASDLFFGHIRLN